MTEQEKGHVRHIATIARAARRELRIGNPGSVLAAMKTLEQIELSARHALAACLPSAR